MYEGFKLELDVGYDAQFFGEHCKQIGKRHLSEQKHIISQNLKHYRNIFKARLLLSSVIPTV